MTKPVRPKLKGLAKAIGRLSVSDESKDMLLKIAITLEQTYLERLYSLKEENIQLQKELKQRKSNRSALRRGKK